MSDVFGEFIDHSEGTDDDSAWLLGEDLPNQPPARSMKNPPAFDQPDRVGGTNWTDGRAGGQTDDDNGGVHTNSGVGNKAAYLITDGTTGEPGGTFNGESFPGLTVDKAKWIYWGAQNLLTPGSDYADLANGLYASCTALVGNARHRPGRLRRHRAAGDGGDADAAAQRPVGAAERHDHRRLSPDAHPVDCSGDLGPEAGELLSADRQPVDRGRELAARSTTRARAT